MKQKQEAIFLTQWKEEVTRLFHSRYRGTKGWDPKKIEPFLDKKIKETMHNPTLTVQNNYQNRYFAMDLLKLIDLIEENHLIIGGAGVLYMPHDKKLSLLVRYISSLMIGRDAAKDRRNQYEVGSEPWMVEELDQIRKKIKINALFGAHGYPGFFMYNRYIAESITNQGRQIICTCVQAFEMFLSDNFRFATENELYHYVHCILLDYKKEVKDGYDIEAFYQPEQRDLVRRRLLEKCGFSISSALERQMDQWVSSFRKGEIVLLWFKNNLDAFHEMEFIQEKYALFLRGVPEFRSPDLSTLEEYPDLQKVVKDIWDFYDHFVLYNHPIYDRVRKSMYTDKKSVLYVDTDSNFVGLHPIVTYLLNTCLESKWEGKSFEEMEFAMVNVATYMIDRVVDRALKELVRTMNVSSEWAELLRMKNEVTIRRIVFVMVKKRYLALTVLKERTLLNGGKGKVTVTGMDFIKAGTKPFLQEYFDEITEHDLLQSKEIDVLSIFQKMQNLRNEIRDSVRKGDSQYFRQVTVQNMEHYANPYSIQQVKAVLVWNALMPDHALDLPAEIDIVPIKDLSSKTNQRWFSARHPKAFQLLERSIFNSPLEPIRKMKLNCIAKPRVYLEELPPWFSDLVDTDKIENNSLKLFFPVMNAIGMKMPKSKQNTTHLSTFVDL